MKKITGFFLAILPLFITILLFATGFIVKQGKHIDVTDVRFASESYVIQKTDETEVEEDLGFSVSPKNATNPDVVFKTAEGGENIVQVDATGMATAKDWGETTVYIYSKENPTINSKASLKVTDDKFHKFEVTNQTNAEYLGYNQEVKLEVVPHPAATDVKHDPTIKFYSTDESIVEVAADGTLKAKDKDGEVTIYIYNEPSHAVSEFKTRVSKGVYLADFGNPSDTVVASKSLDLSADLFTYPDTTVASRPAEFNWTSANEEIAKVDENGKVTFLQPGQTTFYATYKRNPLVFTYKTIKSTCSDLYDVNFNKYNYVGTTGTETGYADITCETFPANDQSKLIVESSDETVIKPELVDNVYKFKIVGTGKAILKATFIGAVGAEPVTDSCSVTIKEKDGTSLILQKSLTTDSYYYSLRDNVNLNSFDSVTQNIEWSMTDEESVAELDKTNGIVHFTKSGFVNVTVKVGTSSDTFTLVCTGKDSKELDPDAEEIHLTVGTKCLFSDDWEADVSSYSGSFDVISETGEFIPKCGGSFDIRLTKLLHLPRYVTLVVEEKPAAIKYETTAKPYIATAEETYSFKESVLASSPVIPSTATKADGTAYTVDCKYEADEGVATVEDDVITFEKAGEVKVTVSLGSTNIVDTFIVKSTMGASGKFYLEKDSADQLYSGDSIQLDVGKSESLYLTTTLAGTTPSQEMLDSMTVTSTNSDIEVDKAYDTGTSKITFTVKAKSYGQSQLLITNNTFTYTLNVNISSKISNFYLYYQGSLLSKEENNTFYVNDDVELSVIVSPISAAESAGKEHTLHTKYTAKLNSTPITISEDSPLTLDISGLLTGGTDVLTLTSVDDPQITASFNLVYKDTIEATDFDLEGTSAKTGYDGQIYMPATDTQSVTPITLKGFANDEFYSRFSTTTEHTSINLGRVINDSIAKPTVDEPSYEKEFVLKYDDGTHEAITKKYYLTREIVSRITFPGHDNWDETDAKGLQKVHVYGDMSWFDDKQTEVANFYRLPINLYDFQGKLIKDTLEEAEAEGSIKVTKENAFNTLIYNSSDTGTTVLYATPDDYSKEGYIQLGFSNCQKYTFEEMYNNAFAKKQNKSVTFTLGTHNYETYADYTFVVTGGVNAYCQKALSGAVTDKNWGIILQTNFGKEGTEKDNVPYTQPNSWLPNLFGNGYTLNLNCAEKQWGPSKTALIYSLRQMNIVLQGCNQSTMTHDNHICLCPRHEWHSVGDPNCYMAYCEIKCFPEGVDYNNDEAEHHIKNCVFHHNLDYSIKAMTSKVNVDIEDCVFYNCGSFGIFAWDFPTIRFKGMIDVYNFHNKEMLENIQGFDLSFAWNTVLEVAKSQQVVQIGADGRDYINSFMAAVLAKSFYFWNPETGAYEKSDNGFAGNGEYLYKYGDVSLPFIGGIKLWGTQIPSVKQHAPDYYDMYDTEGKIKPEFIANELAKITRTRTIWELRNLW